MANKTVKTRIVHKHDIPSNWARATNFVPKQGELIIYDDRKLTINTSGVVTNQNVVSPRVQYKIGNGVQKVEELPFVDDELMLRVLNHLGFYEYPDLIGTWLLPESLVTNMGEGYEIPKGVHTLNFRSNNEDFNSLYYGYDSDNLTRLCLFYDNKKVYTNAFTGALCWTNGDHYRKIRITETPILSRDFGNWFSTRCTLLTELSELTGRWYFNTALSQPQSTDEIPFEKYLGTWLFSFAVESLNTTFTGMRLSYDGNTFTVRYRLPNLDWQPVYDAQVGWPDGETYRNIVCIDPPAFSDSDGDYNAFSSWFRSNTVKIG